MQTATATIPKKRKPQEHRQQAAAKARQMGVQSRYISQRGKYDDCMLYVETGVGPQAWGEPKPTIKLVKTSLPTSSDLDAVSTTLPAKVDIAVNAPLLPQKRKMAAKGVLANGRSEKGVPKFENWFCRIYPRDITYPAWKELSKTATDIANICFAKRDHARASERAKGKKESDIDPLFKFTFKEAVGFFKISRPTFDKSIKQLIRLGLIELETGGGIFDGKGIPATYRCIDAWKNWQPDQLRKKPQSDKQKETLHKLNKTKSQ